MTASLHQDTTAEERRLWGNDVIGTTSLPLTDSATTMVFLVNDKAEDDSIQIDEAAGSICGLANRRSQIESSHDLFSSQSSMLSTANVIVRQI